MVVLGRVTAPFGVHGWVRIHPYADDPSAWSALERWWLAPESAQRDWVAYGLRECREHGGGLVASLEGIADRTAAEALKGYLVAVLRDDLPETAEDEFYWADLIGLTVVNEEGEALGTIAELISTGAHEVLVVRGAEDGKERLLPFVEAVVREVDRGVGQVRVVWQRDW